MSINEERVMYGLLHVHVHCICFISQLNSEISVAKRDLRRAQTIMQMDELKCRKRVLRR